MSEIVHIHESMSEIPGKVRIEVGPPAKRITAIASKELLSDEVTARHYHAPVLDEEGRVLKIAKDALGKPIKLGEPCTLVDWYAERVWHVYVMDVRLGDNGLPLTDVDGIVQTYWRWAEEHKTKDEALARMPALAAGLEG